MYNYQKYQHIQPLGWTLGWAWSKKEVIWSMVGSQATEQGDCSKFKGNIPHCCKRNPSIVDLLPEVESFNHARREILTGPHLLANWARRTHRSDVTSAQEHHDGQPRGDECLSTEHFQWECG